MGWSIGYDNKWQRDIGYAVTAYCDYPGCSANINRGLSHVCGKEPFGGESGCGLYFCGKHLNHENQCARCENDMTPFEPKVDHPDWIQHKLTHESWKECRENMENEIEEIENPMDELKKVTQNILTLQSATIAKIEDLEEKFSEFEFLLARVDDIQDDILEAVLSDLPRHILRG